MSLLLDALKKAEQDKKKSADQTTDDSPADTLQDDNESLELELEIDQPQKDEAVADDESLHTQPPEGELADTDLPEVDLVEDDFPEVDETALQSSHVEHPSQDEVTEASEQTADETEADTSHAETSEIAPVDTSSEQGDDIEDTPVSFDHADETDETESSAADDTAAHSITETESASPTDEPEIATADIASTQTPSAAGQASLGGDASDHQAELDKIEKEKALSALINKTNHHESRHKLKQRLLILLIVLLILFGSAIYFYLQMQTSTQDLYLATDRSAPINRQAAKVITPQTPTTTRKAPVVATKAVDTALVKSTQTTPIVKASPAPAKVATYKPPAKNTATAAADSQVLSIEHSTKPDPISLLLKNAYQAFQRGQLKQSHRDYSSVLVREPRNRDALLGIAAIATRQQQYEAARQAYQTLLRHDPRDSIATAGLSNLDTLANAQLSESQLKLMIKDQPRASHLYFALGNIYARQNRWPEAQSAYFSAWSASNTNADYAYNLAVSLDHLNKPRQAIDFYQLSLKLQDNSEGNFSTDTITRRIQSLKEIAQ